MTAGFLGRMRRVGLVAGVVVLFSATITLAATSTLAPSTPPAATPTIPEPQPLVVPDVRNQAYVFAKGLLEQEGFAWRVDGAVPGYAANVVVSQRPAPGSRLVPDGAPVIVLRLSRNPAYTQEGAPENFSPYPGRRARLVGAIVEKPTPKAKPKARPKPAAAAAPTAKPAKQQPAKKQPAKKAAAAPAERAPAFAAPGAPPEPLDEITLSARAKRLAVWVEAHPRRSRQNVGYWLYQHNWIVTGARFGWSNGAAALRTLVEVDARVQELWGVGSQSEQLARRSLAEVEARSR